MNHHNGATLELCAQRAVQLVIGEDTTPRFSFGLLASTLANALKFDVQSTTNYHSKQPYCVFPGLLLFVDSLFDRILSTFTQKLYF